MFSIVQHSVSPFWSLLIWLFFVAKVNITFGEYQGVYENIDEVDIKNVFLKNAAAGHRRPEFRRFSHLKLMMSVMLGSGALACKHFLESSRTQFDF